MATSVLHGTNHSPSADTTKRSRNEAVFWFCVIAVMTCGAIVGGLTIPSKPSNASFANQLGTPRAPF